MGFPKGFLWGTSVSAALIHFQSMEQEHGKANKE